MLGRKLMRELRRQRGQVIAVLAVIALGVMLFVTSSAAYLDLRDSYAATRRELALADYHIDTTEAIGADTVARIAALPSVSKATTREVAEVLVPIDDAHAQLRLLSLPEHGQPALDRVLVLAGQLPAAGEVLVEKHFAERHHLQPGAILAIVAPPRTLRVSGIAVSAEYLWVARDRVDFMPDPAEFGVGWVIEREVTGLPVSGHQLLVELASGYDPGPIVQVVGADRVIRTTAEDQLVGVRLLQLDVDGYRGMAAFFPVFFLGVGAFIVAAILARLVDAQRMLIGTLMALGIDRRRMLVHYIAYGLVLGGAGGLLGVAMGTALAPAMTHAYATELGIPFVTTRVHFDLASIGLALGFVVASLAAVVPAIHAIRMSPAQAMRPSRPNTGALARAARRLRAPLPVEMAVRDLLGRPLRSLATAIGVAAALVVVLTTGGLLDSMRTTTRSTFEEARREDLRVELAAPVSIAEARERLAAIPNVQHADYFITVPGALVANGRSVETYVQGLSEDTTLVRSIDSDGTVVAPRPGEIVMPRGVAHTLRVARGDTVDVRVSLGGHIATARLRVGGFADATIGPLVTVQRAELSAALGVGDAITSVALTVDAGRKRVIRGALASLPSVARVQDTAAVRARMNELMSLGWVMLGAMLLFGSILAAAILFSTAVLGVLEHRRDLATLRALGRTMREIAIALTIEHGLLALAGIAIGIPLARLATRQLVQAFSSDLFALPFVISPLTLLLSTGGVFVVLLVAQWPALRSVARMSLAESVRSREG